MNSTQKVAPSRMMPESGDGRGRESIEWTGDRPLLVVLSDVASSSVASLSSASFCDAAAACRSLVLVSRRYSNNGILEHLECSW